MSNAVQNIARSIDDVTRTVWDQNGTVVRVLVLVLLVISGVGIPLIIIALLARLIVKN